MKQIRLAYLVSKYPAISHTFILREVRALRELGFDIHVASINSPDRPPAGLTTEEREEAQGTFYVKDAGMTRLLSAHLGIFASHPAKYFKALLFALRLGGIDFYKMLYGLFYFAEAVLLAEWMADRRMPHLHVHFATPASTVGLILTRLAPITLSITVHGPDEFYEVQGFHLAEKIASATFLCTIGKFARSQLMKISPPSEWGKFEVAPLGVDPERFAMRPCEPAAQPFEVICVGRLVPAKGQHILLAAIDSLRREGRHVVLRLVGDGPDRVSLERDAADRGIQKYVIFEGAVNQDLILKLYGTAAAFVLPSFAEGIPVVLMEAMALGIPCITTFITGIPELIRPDVDGILVTPSDVDELARAIASLMDDRELRQRLGRAGRERVLECYDLRHNVRRLAAIYRRRLQGAA